MAYRRKYDPRSRSGRAAYNRRHDAAKKGWANRGKKKSSGCYIATCVYGSYDCPEVWTLRRFRDQTLSKTLLGRGFINFYYAISPIVVRLFGKKKVFHKFWKPLLDRMVHNLNGRGISSKTYLD